MKIRSVVTLVGLAISFALLTFAQQKNTTDQRIVQQRDLLGVAKALDEFGEINQGLDEAYNRNDAAAVAALFTEDALLVAPDGMFRGRQKMYADTFQRSPIISFERRYLNAIDNAVWGAGQWTSIFSKPDWFCICWATGQRFLFVRVMLGRSACGPSTRRHRRLRVLRQSRRASRNRGSSRPGCGTVSNG